MGFCKSTCDNLGPWLSTLTVLLGAPTLRDSDLLDLGRNPYFYKLRWTIPVWSQEAGCCYRVSNRRIRPLNAWAPHRLSDSLTDWNKVCVAIREAVFCMLLVAIQCLC